MNTACARVLAAMRSHGSVTPRSFRTPTIDGGDEMDRLAARVNELRDAGYDIETVIERSPAGKRYARYFLRARVPRPSVSSVPSSPTEPRADLKTAEGTLETPALFDMPPVPNAWDTAA